jgi:hypothetical protein
MESTGVIPFAGSTIKEAGRFCCKICVVPSTGVVGTGFVVGGSDITQAVRAKLSEIAMNAIKVFVYFIVDADCEK